MARTAPGEDSEAIARSDRTGTQETRRAEVGTMVYGIYGPSAIPNQLLQDNNYDFIDARKAGEVMVWRF